MIDMSSLPLLEGKKALVTGIANDQSIAWGCARPFARSAPTSLLPI
jgi:enoyl-[acyl-carrier protein] reductase I